MRPTTVIVVLVVALVAPACSKGYPDNLDEQLASFSDSTERRRAILEANGIAVPREASEVAAGTAADGADDLGGDGADQLDDGDDGPDEDLTEQQRALRDGSIVATALPAAVDLGDDWWTTSFDPDSEIDDAVESFDGFRSCELLVSITEQSDHRALAGAWYGDQRDLQNIQIWNRLFETPTAAANWFAAESSQTAMGCVRNLYLVTYEVDQVEIEGLIYDDVVFSPAELGVPVPDDVEIAVFRSDTPARIDGEIVFVDSVAEIRILVDRMVIALRILTEDAVSTAVLADTFVPTVIAQARSALAGDASV